MKYKLKYSDIWVTLAAKPFAGGGEGNLYMITSPAHLKHYVAKIYHPHKLTPLKAEKINYLAQYPPIYVGENLDEHPPVVWVKDALYDNDKFVGFIMPYTQGEKLEILCTPKIPSKLNYLWGRFNFNSPNALDYRLKLCFNICVAIHQVHAMDRYVLVDMKPDNIVIQPNGLVSIVDTDSVEVVQEGRSVFDAPVATPEYTPPEFYVENLEHDPTTKEAWDRFGLGVILYKLLFGIHPFAASSGYPYEDTTSLHEKIKHGLFVHNPDKQSSFTAIPPLHKGFYQIDENLQALFMRCFVDGHENPEARPTAEEWCATILLTLDDEAAYQRYGHILTGGVINKKPRFPLPSSRMVLPEYPESIYKLLELNKEKEIPKPKLANPNPNQMEGFDIKTMSPIELVGTIVLLGVLSVIGTPVLGVVALAFVLNRMYKDYKEDGKYKLRKFLESDIKQMNYEYHRKYTATKYTQKKFHKAVKKFIPDIEQTVVKIKKRIEGLNQFILDQDTRVKELETNAIAQFNKLNKKYAQEALANRILARMSDNKIDNLSKIRISINQSYKKAVDSLIKEKPIREDHPDIQNGKIAIDSLVQDKKLKIKTSVEDEIKKLKEELANKLADLEAKKEEDSNFITRLQELWTDSKPAEHEVLKLQRILKNMGIQSVNQIDAINEKAYWVHFDNGEKVNLKWLSGTKNVLKNLKKWWDMDRGKMATYEKEKVQLILEYQKKITDLEEQQRIDLKGLEKLQKEEMQKVKIAVQRTVLGDSFDNLQKDYESANQYVELLEKEFVQQEKVLLHDYKLEYEEILEACKNKIAETEKEIRLMEESVQKHQKKINDPKIQAQFKEYETELQELKSFLPKLERKDFELKKLENITFSNYVKTLIGR